MRGRLLLATATWTNGTQAHRSRRRARVLGFPWGLRPLQLGPNAYQRTVAERVRAGARPVARTWRNAGAIVTTPTLDNEE